jgi:hypothetical protein
MTKLVSIISKYIDHRDFLVVKTEKNIYVIDYDTDDYCLIRCDDTGFCSITIELYHEIVSFFSIEDDDVFESSIIEWLKTKVNWEIKRINVSIVKSYWLRNQFLYGGHFE